MCAIDVRRSGETAADYRRRRLIDIGNQQRNVSARIRDLRERAPRLYRQLAPLLDDLSDWMRDVSWHLKDIDGAEQLKPAQPVQQECKG